MVVTIKRIMFSGDNEMANKAIKKSIKKESFMNRLMKNFKIFEKIPEILRGK